MNSLSSSSSKWGASVSALALGSGLLLMPQTAEAQQEHHAFTVGLHLGFSISSRPAFTIGPDIRYAYMFRPGCDPTVGCSGDYWTMGVFFQPTYMAGGAWRFTGGVHGGTLMEKIFYPNPELGISYRTVSTEGAFAGGYGLHLGIASMFSLLGFPMEQGPALRANIALSPGMGSEFILGHDFRAPGVCYFLDGCSLAVAGRALRYEEEGPIARASMRARRRRGVPHHLASRAPRAGRQALFDYYAETASMECASVPAFLALARDLGKAGAPSALVERVIRSARDEEVHTDLMRKLAGGFGDLDLSVLAPPTPEASDEDWLSLCKRLARESFWDGCVNEGAAAALARRQREASKNEDVREALAVIAKDEQGHADLSERIVAFCLEIGGKEVRDHLHESVEERAEEMERAEAVGETDEPELVAFGLPTAAMESAAREEALRRSGGLLG